MADLKVAKIPMPTGWDASSSPDTVPMNRAVILENFLTHRPGRLIQRGGFQTMPFATNSGGLISGMATLGLNVLLGQATTGSLTPYAVPTFSGTPTTERNLFTVAADGTVATGAQTNVSSTVEELPSARAVRYGGRIYVLGAASAATISTDKGNEPLRHILGWNGGGSGSVVQYANTPRGSFDIISYKERLFALGGTPASSPTLGPFAPTTLYYTDALAGATTAIPDAATAWQDDISLLDNKIQLSGDVDDYGVAFANISNGLAILCKRSIWVLRGDGPNSFTVRRFSASVGCSYRDSVVEYEDGVLFANREGLWYFDGYQLQLMSADIADAWRYINDAAQIVYTAAHAARLRDNFYIITFYELTASAAAGHRRTLLFHVPSRSWSEVTMLAEQSLPVMFVPMTANNSQVVLSPNRYLIYDANKIVTNTGNNTEVAYNGATTLIPSRVRFRRFPLSSPGYQSLLHMVWIDYASYDTTGTGAAAFTGTLYDDTLTPIAASFPLPGQTTGQVGPMRSENLILEMITDAYLEVTTTAATNTTAFTVELTGVAAGFAIGPQRRGN